MPSKSAKRRKVVPKKSAQTPKSSARSAKRVTPIKSKKKMTGTKSKKIGAKKTASKTPSTRRRDTWAKVVSAIKEHGDELRSIPGVLKIRPGYLFKKDRITPNPAIIVVVNPRNKRVKDAIKKEIAGAPVQVRMATPVEQLHEIAPLADTEAMGVPATVEEDLALPGWNLVKGDAEGDAIAADTSTGLLEYKPPPGVNLLKITEPMSVTCHVSPEEGWRNLSGFLTRAQDQKLTIAMYDFTAPHVLKKLRETMKKKGNLQLILDPNVSKDGAVKANDVFEEEVRDELADDLKKRFSFLWAAVKRKGKVTRGIFPTSYHIKVAVSGGKSFWLSSGNLQSSNQPDVDSLDLTLAQLQGRYNREWHVIVEHTKLASVYEKFIEQDMKQAKGLQVKTAGPVESDVMAVLPPEMFISLQALSDAEADDSGRKVFKPETFTFDSANPLKVHQLLTPDNFAEEVAPVIRKAKKKLYFQNQYIKVNEFPSKQFTSLLKAVLKKVADGLEDVRIILRELPDAAAQLEALQYYAWENFQIDDLSFIRYQPGSHTKGIIVDSSVVVIGSHNWSNQGVSQNRDASLIFFNPEIAQYYEKVFLYDFKKLAKRQVMSDEEMPVVNLAGEAPPVEMDVSNMVSVPWDYFEDAD